LLREKRENLEPRKVITPQKPEMGPDGFCICPKCGERIEHRKGVPCKKERCPECETKMVREYPYRHQLRRKRSSG